MSFSPNFQMSITFSILHAGTKSCKNQNINNQDLCRPIFCLYGVYDTKHGNTSFISIPEKMKAFGTYAVVVTDVEEFLNRLRRVPLIFSPIDYQELDLHDPNSKTPFRPYFHMFIIRGNSSSE